MRTTTIVALLVAALATGRAQAAPAEDAEAYIKRGVGLRRLHNDAAALQEFRRAYEIAPSGRAAAQLGLAEQQLKLWVDADRHLGESLRDHSDAWVRQNRTVLEKSRRTVANHVGRLAVGGEPAGAEVFINGQNAGTVPLREPATVSPGPVRVEVRSPGYTSSSMSVVVAAGDQSRVDVRLERDRTLTPAALSEPAAGPSVGRAAAGPSLATSGPPPMLSASGGVVSGGPVITPVRDEAEPPDHPTPEGPSPGLRTARWVMIGATGAFLAAGIAGLIIREHEVGMFNASNCGIDPVNGNVVNRPKPASIGYCRTVVDNANTGRTVGIVGLAGAGLLAVTSAVLFLAF